MLTSAAKAVLVAMIDVVRMMTTAAIVLLNLILIYAVISVIEAGLVLHDCLDLLSSEGFCFWRSGFILMMFKMCVKKDSCKGRIYVLNRKSIREATVRYPQSNKPTSPPVRAFDARCNNMLAPRLSIVLHYNSIVIGQGPI
eukprot:scaffold9061_cov236-Skeletonema_marinoi.AAC.7